MSEVEKLEWRRVSGLHAFCVPTEDLCETMQIPKENAAKPRKFCCGMAQPPFEWHEPAQEHFLLFGFRPSFAVPCCWILLNQGSVNAIISGHVDDCILVGDENDPVYLPSAGLKLITLIFRTYMSHAIPIPLKG